MNLLDENFPADQVELLRSRGIRVRKIGPDIGRAGMQDVEILTLLHASIRPTLFTLDADFASPRLCHPAYCLVFLYVHGHEAAAYVRRILRHPELNTQAKRMGTYVRASYNGIRVWRRNEAEQAIPWPQASR
jgi:hypothetical protein